MKLVSVFRFRLWFCGLLLLLLGGAGPARAQFNPPNPPNPNAKYSLVVGVEGTGGYASGSGQYLENASVYVRCSANAGYKFSHWTENGVRIDKGQNFYYYMPAKNVELVAHFEYNPSNPDNPQATPDKRRLTLTSTLSGCSFNVTSGQRWTIGSVIKLTVYGSQGYRFLGWYNGDELVNANTSFSYKMPDYDVTLTASFEFDPGNPDNPQNSGQTDVDNEEPIYGDVVTDGQLTQEDADGIARIVIHRNFDDLDISAADVNRDGRINITDIATLVNLIQSIK